MHRPTVGRTAVILVRVEISDGELSARVTITPDVSVFDAETVTYSNSADEVCHIVCEFVQTCALSAS